MKDAILTALLEWNPWIENEFPAVLFGIARDAPLLTYLALPEIKILEGVRRSGKSTLLYQVAAQGVADGKRVLYINFEDEVLRHHTLSDIYYAYLSRSKVDYLLLDEIQHCSDWVPFVRKFYDRKQLDQIWITGSNSSLIGKEYSEVLTGRNIKLRIMPLAFSEYLRFTGYSSLQFPLSSELAVDVKKSFENYLTFGAFPAITLRSVYQRELLTNYFEDFLFKDIATRHDVNTSKLRDLAIYLVTHSAKIVSYNNLSKALSLHPTTVSDYVSYMKEVFLLDEVYKFDYSLKKQYVNDKKIYLVDTGLGHAVSFRFSDDRGRMLETVVYQALKHQKKEIYLHREKKECDFIIKEGLDIVQAIQVTHSLADPQTKAREIAGLVEAMKTYHLKEGTILTSDETDVFSVDLDGVSCTVLVKPVWKWLLTCVAF